jgi:hypothetical protein
MAAVINRAIDDLRDTDPKLRAVEKDRAMAFVLSDDCEAWCLELEMNYEAVKEKAAALYRCFLEKSEGCEKASWKSGAGAGKLRPMARPEGRPQSIRRSQTAMVLSRKE